MRLLARLLLLGLACVLASCGGSSGSSGGGTDPAKFMPANATVYVEAVVRPEGDQRERMEALAAKILRSDDPGTKLKELFDEAVSKEEPGTSYDKNVAPWLGERLGAAFSDFQRDEPRFVVAIAASDADAARDELARRAKADKDRQGAYGDVDYWINKDGQAAGVVEDAVLVASDEAQFKRGVDAAKGDSLADADRFKNALDGLPEDRVGTFFLDLPKLVDLATAQAGASEAAMIKPLLKGLTVTSGAVLAQEDAIGMETRTRTPQGGSALGSLVGFGALGATDLVKSAPSGSWAVLGVPKLGETARETVKLLGGALGSAVIGSQLEQQLGIDLESDVYAWIGDVAVFVRGDAVERLDGGLMIQVTDMDKARQAIPKLIGLARQQGGVAFEPAQIDGASLAFKAAVPGAPGPAVVALGDGRAVIALGEAAARDALKPSETIGDSGLYDQGKELIDGIDPSLLVDGAAVMKLVTAAAGSDADFQKAKPYLDMLGVMAAGSQKDGDDVRSRLGVKLR